MTITTIIHVVISFVVIIISLTFHEFSHAAAANSLGDPTAKKLGRMSLNPLVHIDLIGTVLLPLTLALMGLGVFGWAKPVPVNIGNLHHPKRDNALVSAAGPAANLALAFLTSFMIRLILLSGNITEGRSFLLYILIYLVKINIFLMLFNLLPITPLDGSGVLQFFLSPKAMFSYHQWSKKIMLVFLFILLMTNWLYTLYLRPVGNIFLSILQQLAGIQLVNG